jgi:hypothetical protein
MQTARDPLESASAESLLAFKDLAEAVAAGGGLLSLLAFDPVQALLDQDLGHVADGPRLRFRQGG